MRTIVFVIIAVLIPALVYAEGQEEFILGLFQTHSGGCMHGYPIDRCCPDTFWGEYIIPDTEHVLIESIHANTLHSHYYGLDDFLPVLRYCESTQGRVKMYAGLEYRTPPQQDYWEFGHWAPLANQYNSAWWQDSVGQTLDLYDTLFHYLSSPGLRGIYILHETARDTSYYEGLAAMIDSVKNHDREGRLKFVAVDKAYLFTFPQFTQTLDSLDYFEEDYYNFGSWGVLNYFTGPTYQSEFEQLFDIYANDWEKFKGTHTKWMPAIWTCANAIPRTDYDCYEAGLHIASSVYFARPETAKQAQSIKMVLLK